jgi:hypothetical protein
MFPFWVDVSAALCEQLLITVLVCGACLSQLWASFRML